MTLAINKKAQILVLDILMLLIIILLILSIEEKNINNYTLNIKHEIKNEKIIQEQLVLDKLISDCNYLAKQNKTKVCYSNEIELKNINKIDRNICYLKIGLNTYLNTNKEKTNIYKRGIIYNNVFEIIEVGFCE